MNKSKHSQRKNPLSKEPSVNDYHVQRKLLAAFEGLDKVLEERNIMNQLKQIADMELALTITQILELPDDHPNWENNIATLIGTARAHRAYSEIYTIKEK